MKIMFYINTISYGGAERVIVNLAEQFSEKGHAIVFVTSFAQKTEYELSGEIDRRVLLDKPVDSFVERNFRCVIGLRRLIRNEKPDIVVSFLAEPNFRAIVSCIGTKTKRLVSVRNDPDKEYGNLVFRLCAKLLYCLANGVVFQTRDAQAWFPRRVRNRSRIIFNQVNERFFRYELEKKRKDVVTVGRLEEQKNHELLIRAFSLIADRVTDKLIIYGEGSKRRELEALISMLHLSDRVLLPGVITDVPEKLSTAKLFVLSSDYEGMPNALIEAMVLGLPCISTDCPCGGPRELFAEQRNGMLVPVGDERALAEKMLYLLENETARENLGSRAKTASSKFSPGTVFEQWENYIVEIVDE